MLLQFQKGKLYIHIYIKIYYIHIVYQTFLCHQTTPKSRQRDVLLITNAQLSLGLGALVRQCERNAGHLCIIKQMPQKLHTIQPYTVKVIFSSTNKCNTPLYF